MCRGGARERAARAQERLAAQRAEAKANPEYGQTFKGPASADDKKARRKQILSTIGARRRRGRPPGLLRRRHPCARRLAGSGPAVLRA